MDWKQLLVYVSGSEEELLLRMESLVAENRILRAHMRGRIQLSNAERKTFAEIGTKLSKQARHAPGLVPQAGGAEVRRLHAAQEARTATYRPRVGRAGSTPSARKPLLGLRPYPRGVEALGLSHQRPNRGQYSQAPSPYFCSLLLRDMSYSRIVGGRLLTNSFQRIYMGKTKAL